MDKRREIVSELGLESLIFLDRLKMPSMGDYIDGMMIAMMNLSVLLPVKEHQFQMRSSAEASKEL